MHGREGGRHNQQQSWVRSMSAVFVTCALRSVKLPHRDTWLLAHLIHFSPVILRRWRTSRAPTPCPGRQCWCWSLCCIWQCEWPWCQECQDQAQLLELGYGSWQQNVPCPPRSTRVTSTLHCWHLRVNTWHWGNPGKRNHPWATHAKTSLRAVIKDLPRAGTCCHSISEAAKSHQILLKYVWINSYLGQFSNFKYF